VTESYKTLNSLHANDVAIVRFGPKNIIRSRTELLQNSKTIFNLSHKLPPYENWNKITVRLSLNTTLTPCCSHLSLDIVTKDARVAMRKNTTTCHKEE